MLDLVFALLAGVITIAAPCTLPMLPVLLGASVGQTGKARPVMIALGFELMHDWLWRTHAQLPRMDWFVVLAIPLGIIAAVRRGRAADLGVPSP